MISASLAMWVLIGLVVAIAVIIPLLDSVEKFSKFISLRWTCVSIILLIMVGVIINFEHLADSTRDIVIRGGLVIVGIYLVLRTLEKILHAGWLKGLNLKGSIEKNGFKATAEVNQAPNVENKEDKKEEKPVEE